jgi:streptomycin 6-kinase
LLLERLKSGRDLYSVPIDEACQVIGGLLRQLDHLAIPQLSRLSTDSAGLAKRLASAPSAIPRRFVERARTLLSDLATDDLVDSRMVHTDMHDSNVLAADRQPWLAIDPKPLAADPGFAVTPALWNRWEHAVASGDMPRHLRRRLSIICEGAVLDEERTRAWSIVREVQMALWAVQDHDTDELTKAVAIIKAMEAH